MLKNLTKQPVIKDVYFYRLSTEIDDPFVNFHRKVNIGYIREKFRDGSRKQTLTTVDNEITIK
jgi:hypothetical protein